MPPKVDGARRDDDKSPTEEVYDRQSKDFSKSGGSILTRCSAGSKNGEGDLVTFRTREPQRHTPDTKCEEGGGCARACVRVRV